MDISLMIGLGVILVIGVVIGIMIDVDTFAGGLFSKFSKDKDPNRED